MCLRGLRRWSAAPPALIPAALLLQVPIQYVNEIGWQQEILRFAPTLLLIAGYIYITRRTMGGGGGGLGGLGGGGARSIFNVGKAQVGHRLSHLRRGRGCPLTLPRSMTGGCQVTAFAVAGMLPAIA